MCFNNMVICSLWNAYAYHSILSRKYMVRDKGNYIYYASFYKRLVEKIRIMSHKKSHKSHIFKMNIQHKFME